MGGASSASRRSAAVVHNGMTLYTISTTLVDPTQRHVMALSLTAVNVDVHDVRPVFERGHPEEREHCLCLPSYKHDATIGQPQPYYARNRASGLVLRIVNNVTCAVTLVYQRTSHIFPDSAAVTTRNVV